MLQDPDQHSQCGSGSSQMNADSAGSGSTTLPFPDHDFFSLMDPIQPVIHFFDIISDPPYFLHSFTNYSIPV
jgi:hypothetical protein